MDDLERVVDAAVELAESLPSTCLLDYIEDPSIAGAHDDDYEFDQSKEFMSLNAIGRAMGVTRETVRQIEEVALTKVRAAKGMADFAVGAPEKTALEIKNARSSAKREE